MKEPNVLFFNGRFKLGDKIETLALAEVEAKFGFEYLSGSLRESVQACIPAHIFKQRGLSVLDNPEASIMIHETCKAMGNGLVALKPIPAKTIVLEYVGEERSIFGPEDSTYAVAVGDPASKVYDRDYATLVANFKRGIENPGADTVCIDANLKGNLSRFACHMPDEIPSSLIGKYKVKLANLDLETMPDKTTGKPRAFLITKSPIVPAEELGFDYASQYNEMNGINPIYYNTETQKFFRVQKTTLESKLPNQLSSALSDMPELVDNNSQHTTINAVSGTSSVKYVRRDSTCARMSRGECVLL